MERCPTCRGTNINYVTDGKPRGSSWAWCNDCGRYCRDMAAPDQA